MFDWLLCKDAETRAAEKRREAEDELIQCCKLTQTEGSKTIRDGEYKASISFRTNTKIDGDLLQEIAIENGTEDHLGALFAWKPKINMRVWRSTSKKITGPLEGAITTEPGRPSFKITKEQTK